MYNVKCITYLTFCTSLIKSKIAVREGSYIFIKCFWSKLTSIKKIQFSSILIKLIKRLNSSKIEGWLRLGNFSLFSAFLFSTWYIVLFCHLLPIYRTEQIVYCIRMSPNVKSKFTVSKEQDLYFGQRYILNMLEHLNPILKSLKDTRRYKKHSI